jgi:hypothetical protein
MTRPNDAARLIRKQKTAQSRAVAALAAAVILLISVTFHVTAFGAGVILGAVALVGVSSWRHSVRRRSTR